MQKNPAAEYAAAFHMLTSALPDDFNVGRAGTENPPAAIRLRVPSLEAREAWFVASPDARVPEGTIRIIVLDGASARQHDSFRRAGLSFVDLAGVVHLKAPGLYVDRMGLNPVRLGISPPTGADPYSDRASRVVRVLLMHPSARRWTTSGLAATADVDVSTASRVVRELRRRDLVLDEAPGQGRSSRIGVTDPAALLGDWTRRYAWDQNRHLRVTAPVGSASRFTPRIGDLFTGRRWALSLQAGAFLVAPHAEFEIVHVYVEEPVEAVAADHGWEPSPTGKLVLMEPAYDNSVWFQEQRLGGAKVVSAVQLVLDLWHYPVRGREQAEHIKETVLRPLWELDAET